MELGDKHLKVQRASIGNTQVSGLEMSVNAMSMLAGTTSQDLENGRVLQLLNMVTPEELIDNEDYEGTYCVAYFFEYLLIGCLEICEDVKEECEKYGKVLEMKVPRPTGGSRQSTGVGKIFVKFDTPDSAGKALKALAGRKFADRTVVTTYFPEVNFKVPPLLHPTITNSHEGKFRSQRLVNVSPGHDNDSIYHHFPLTLLPISLITY